MKQFHLTEVLRTLVATLLICVVPALVSSDLSAQTCTVSASPGTPDSVFNAEYTENGPGTGNEPIGMPGWTGADSTYSVLLPNGDSAFFFSDSYIGEYPAVSGDGTVTTNSNGLRTRAVNCGAPLCSPPTSLYHAHNSIVVQSATTGKLSTLVGPKDPTSGYSTSYFAPATGAVTGHFYWMGDSVVVDAALVRLRQCRRAGRRTGEMAGGRPTSRDRRAALRTGDALLEPTRRRVGQQGGRAAGDPRRRRLHHQRAFEERP